MLYFDLRELGMGKTKMEKLILETSQGQSQALYSALALLHEKYHDCEV
jgi:hypothetical protein